MPKPWETYAAAQSAPKPWERYAAPQGGVDVPGSAENRAEHERLLAEAEAALVDDASLPRKALRTLSNIGEAGTDTLKASGDLAATVGASAVLTPAAGVAGMLSIPFTNADERADLVRKIQGLGYEPRSDVGKEAVETFSKPFEYIASKADSAGQVVADATGSRAAGAFVNAAIQGAPAFITKGARQPFVSAGRGVVDTVKNVVGKPAVAAAAAAPAAAGAAAQPAAAAAAAPNAAATAAQNYARNIGLDWDGLADGIKAKLTEIARTAGALEQLEPAALKRYAQLQGMRVPVPATRGALTRDTQQLLNEDVAKATPEGRPIAEVQNAGDTALQANLDALRGRVAGAGKTAATATNAEEAGRTVQRAARDKQILAKEKTRAAYDRADKSPEAQTKVDTAEIRDLIEKLPDADQFVYAKNWLARNTEGPGSGTKVIDLQELRKLATAKAKNGGEDAHYAHQLMERIDAATESVAGPLYKQARAAHIAERTEFGEQGAVAELVENTSRTDRTLALEKTVETIAKGELEDIRKVKRSLLTGGDAKTRAAGKKAWREVRAQTIERIKREATKGAQEKADGTPKLSLPKLKQVIDSYGPQKLDEIFGPGSAKEVGRILEAARTVKYAPDSLNSVTANKLIAFLSKGLEKIPGGGKLVDVARGIGKVKEIGANARVAETATTVPLNEALGKASARARAADRRQKLAGLKTTPISSLSAGSQQ